MVYDSSYFLQLYCPNMATGKSWNNMRFTIWLLIIQLPVYVISENESPAFLTIVWLFLKCNISHWFQPPCCDAQLVLADLLYLTGFILYFDYLKKLALQLLLDLITYSDSESFASLISGVKINLFFFFFLSLKDFLILQKKLLKNNQQLTSHSYSPDAW